MDLIFAQNPETKKVGLLYDVGQDSSATAIADAKKDLSDRGVEVIERTGTTVDEVALAAQAAWWPTAWTPSSPRPDNTVMTAELSIYETFAEAGDPRTTPARTPSP